MTLKRSTKKGKRLISYDADLFFDANAETNYNEQFSTLTPLVDREVALEDLSQTTIPRLFIHMKWESLLMNLVPPTTQLVREFYSHIHDISKSNQVSIFLRGKIVKIAPNLLSHNLSLPRIDNPISYC